MAERPALESLPPRQSPPSRRRTAVAMLVGNGTTVAITVAQAFLLVPLCLSQLGPSLYGSWIAATELLLWAQQLDAGMTHLLTQRVGAALGRQQPDDAARWSATCLGLIAAVAVVLVCVGIGAAYPVVAWLQVPTAFTPTFAAAFRVGVVASAVLLVSSGVTALSRGMHQPLVPTATGVVGAIAGLVVAIALLFVGWGLWALALGLAARAAVVLVGSVLFLLHLPGQLGDWLLRPSRQVAAEVRGLAPSMTAGTAGYLLANNSELLLVTTFYGPVAAVVYALTRRGIDGVRSLVESVGLAAAPGFAHLVAAEDRHRSRSVLRELTWLRLAAACLGGSMIVAVNEPFVTILFGGEHFGGLILSVLFATQMVVGGQALLLNHILRSAGSVREGAWLRAIDAVVRVSAMSAGLWLVGLSGAPIAGVLVSLGTWMATAALLRRVLPDGPTDRATGRAKAVLVPLLVFAGGVGVALFGVPSSFSAIGLTVTFVGIVGIAVIWRGRPPGAALRGGGLE